MHTDRTESDALPLAYADPTALCPIGNDRLRELTRAFAGKSVAQRYLGPSWTNDEGIACVVFIAHDDRNVRQIRDRRGCGILAWRWDNTPSMYLSLTLLQGREATGPHVRWMLPSDDPVVQAIRGKGRFFMTVVGPRAERAGWYEATFSDHASLGGSSSLLALERLWEMPRAGIPYSCVHTRYVPFDREPANEVEVEQIPLWDDPTSDFWRTLNYEGPWAADLTSRDKILAEWGYHAWHLRHRAAGFVQVLLDRMRLDGQLPIFRDDGELACGGEMTERVHQLIVQYPLLGKWLATLAGPSANAKGAYEAAFDVLSDSPSIFASLDKLFGILADMDDEAVSMACKFSFEAALLDHRITKEGTHRPWLANTKGFALEVKAMPIDIDAPLDDIARLWRSGLEVIDLIDAGLYLTPSDFPAPLDTICEGLESVAIEGSVEHAEERLESLLREAQEARQW